MADAAAPAGSLGAEYFEQLYAEHDDPWGFTERWYEQRKRALLLASLPRPRFARAFEPGCSIGVLTAELAPRCDALLAADVSERAVAAATARLAGAPGVVLEQRLVPGEWPEGSFDLVVLSEVGYYCAAPDLEALAARAAASLTRDGVLVACHWRHRVSDYPVSGDAVHEVLRAQPRLAVLAEHVEEDFRLDVLVPAPATSVARASGVPVE